MRLIDADALREKATLRHGYDFQGVFVKVQDIDKAPTIESAPVVHGRWVDRYGGKYANPIYDCSECGKAALYKHGIDELGSDHFAQALSDVCPNCGARMDGDGKAPTTPTTNHRVCKHCKTAVIGMEEYAECPNCGHPFKEDANG